MRKVRAEVQLKPGVVDWPAVQRPLKEQGIVLVGGGADEAPEVYKRLPEVLAAHAGSIRVKHTLRPLGAAMAGRDVLDPYKDCELLVHRRVGWHRRHERERPALPSQHGTPELIRGVREDVVAQRLFDDPRFFLELGFELPRAPAGIAGEKTSTPRRSCEQIGVRIGSNEADVGKDDRGRVVGLLELGQDDDGLRLDRAADVNDRARLHEVGERGSRFRGHCLRGPVEDDAHRTLLAMLRDEHYRAAEVVVVQGGRCDQELPSERLDGIHVLHSLGRSLGSRN
jgi:hypothetical protein